MRSLAVLAVALDEKKVNLDKRKPKGSKSRKRFKKSLSAGDIYDRLYKPKRQQQVTFSAKVDKHGANEIARPKKPKKKR